MISSLELALIYVVLLGMMIAKEFGCVVDFSASLTSVHLFISIVPWGIVSGWKCP